MTAATHVPEEDAHDKAVDKADDIFERHLEMLYHGNDVRPRTLLLNGDGLSRLLRRFVEAILEEGHN